MSQHTFTPEQAGRLTGISPDRQREWRKQGILPPNTGGWTKYDLTGICRLYLLGAFADSDFNRMLKRAVPVVEIIAPVMAADLQILLVGGTPPDIAAAASGAEVHYAHMSPRVAVLWANGELGVYPTVESAFGDADSDLLAGPVVVLSSSSLWRSLAGRWKAMLVEEAAQ